MCVFVAPWTVAHQAPLSVEFSRQEHWSGVPFPSPGDLPHSGWNLGLPHCRQAFYQLLHQGSYHRVLSANSVSEVSWLTSAHLLDRLAPPRPCAGVAVGQALTCPTAGSASQASCRHCSHPRKLAVRSKAQIRDKLPLPGVR